MESFLDKHLSVIFMTRWFIVALSGLIISWGSAIPETAAVQNDGVKSPIGDDQSTPDPESTRTDRPSALRIGSFNIRMF
ncbi:MAG: hypothetical protein V2B18_10820, partial [Pseudomonadota bacterium]